MVVRKRKIEAGDWLKNGRQKPRQRVAAGKQHDAIHNMAISSLLAQIFCNIKLKNIMAISQDQQ